MRPLLRVVPDSVEMEARAAEIASQLQIRYPAGVEQAGLQLTVSGSGLALSKVDAKHKPIRVDFASGKMRYRTTRTSRSSESIARAVGIKPNYFPPIVDATAGLGKDSFILATLGCPVTMLERSQVVAMLLEDGLQRASQFDALVETIKRMELHHVDACDWLEGPGAPLAKDTVIYLDPMFPRSSSSALPAIEMQVLQELLGKDEDIERLYKVARAAGARRIVMKRPRRAVAFAVRPDFSVMGKSSRFDVFVNPAD